MTVASVRDVINQLASGGLTTAAAARDLGDRDWSSPALSPEELIRGDDAVPPDHDWSVVECARQDGRIGAAQYAALRAAVIGRS